MKNNRKIVSLLLTIVAVLVIAAGVFVFLSLRSVQTVSRQNSNDLANADSDADIEESASGTEITVDGKTYVYNTDIRNVLFLGVDKKDEIMETQEYAGRGGQADCIILLSLNTKEKTATMLNISRDSITDVDVYDMSGDYVGTEKMQLALKYAYGDGEKRSC